MPLYFHIIKVSYAVTSNLMSKKKMKKKKEKTKSTATNVQKLQTSSSQSTLRT